MVIFDEAHNLESVASEAASFELTSAQIAGAQEEALRCYKIFSGGETEAGGADKVSGCSCRDARPRATFENTRRFLIGANGRDAA